MSVLSPVKGSLVKFKLAVCDAVEKTCATADEMSEEQAFKAVTAYIRETMGKDVKFFKITKRPKRRPGAELIREGMIQLHYPDVHRDALRLIAAMYGVTGTCSREGLVSRKIFCKKISEKLASSGSCNKGRLTQTLPSIFGNVYREAINAGGEGVIKLHVSTESADWPDSKGAGIGFCFKGQERVAAAAQRLLNKVES